MGKFLSRIAANPYVAYPAILLLQLKVMWGFWRCRDMSNGDTAAYFGAASLWYHKLETVISWSPLYTIFLGSLSPISSDAHVIVSAHRLIIVLGLAVLVLALMRRLLSPAAAWAIAAWWALQPIVFNALYEVHLFAALLILCCILAVAVFPGARGRGAATAMFLGSAILMRNELLIAAALFGTLSLAAEVLSRDGGRVRRIGTAYGLPLLAVFVVTAALHTRAEDKWPIMREVLHAKHTVNVCQMYAFGYQQRHPEWRHSPFTECQPLIKATFGSAEVSMLEALRANPGAIIEHAVWNARLIPSGLQVLLFSRMTGGPNPDYAPVQESRWAALWSAVVLALLIGAMVRLWGRWGEWWQARIKPNIWIWVAMLCAAAPAVFVMLMQRPRPSYIFAFGILVMALTGLAIDVLFGGSLRFVGPAIMAGTLLLIPGYFNSSACEQPILRAYYRFMKPFAGQMRKGTTLMARWYPDELCLYLGQAKNGCAPLFYPSLKGELEAGKTLQQVIRERGVTHVLIDDVMAADPPVREFLTTAGRSAYRVVRAGEAEGMRLKLLDVSGGGELAPTAAR